MEVAELEGCQTRGTAGQIERDGRLVHTLWVQVLHDDDVASLVDDVDVCHKVHLTWVCTGLHWMEGAPISHRHRGTAVEYLDVGSVLLPVRLSVWLGRQPRVHGLAATEVRIVGLERR